MKSDKPREKEDLVTVTIRIPKQVDRFIRALCAFSGLDIERFYEKELVTAIESITSSMTGPYIDSERIKEVYGLNEVFKKWGL